MSRKLFEFFFDTEELEPFYSELTGARRFHTRTNPRPNKAPNRTPYFQGIQPNPLEDPPRDPDESSHSTVDPSVAKIAEDARVDTRRHKPSGDRDVLIRPTEEAAVSPLETPKSTAENTATTDGTAKDKHHKVVRTRIRNMLSVHSLGQYVFLLDRRFWRRSAVTKGISTNRFHD